MVALVAMENNYRKSQIRREESLEPWAIIHVKDSGKCN